jgi:hypothetical protein
MKFDGVPREQDMRAWSLTRLKRSLAKAKLLARLVCHARATGAWFPTHEQVARWCRGHAASAT